MSQIKPVGRSSTRHRIVIWSLRAGLVVIIFGMWLIGNGPGDVSPLILPKFEDVSQSFAALFNEPKIWDATAVTVGAMLIAFALAAVVGLFVGFLVSRGPIRATTFEPLFAWGYVFPVALLYPLFLIWFGVGIDSKVFYAFVNGFFPIVFNTVRGLRSVEPRYVNVGVAFGASKFQIDWHIKAGGARPMILAGLRLGAAMVAINVVLAEVLGANAGLGYELQQAANTLQIADSYAIIFFLIIVTVILLAIMERVFKSRHV